MTSDPKILAMDDGELTRIFANTLHHSAIGFSKRLKADKSFKTNPEFFWMEAWAIMQVVRDVDAYRREHGITDEQHRAARLARLDREQQGGRP